MKLQDLELMIAKIRADAGKDVNPDVSFFLLRTANMSTTLAGESHSFIDLDIEACAADRQDNNRIVGQNTQYPTRQTAGDYTIPLMRVPFYTDGITR